MVPDAPAEPLVTEAGVHCDSANLMPQQPGGYYVARLVNGNPHVIVVGATGNRRPVIIVFIDLGLVAAARVGVAHSDAGSGHVSGERGRRLRVAIISRNTFSHRGAPFCDGPACARG